MRPVGVILGSVALAVMAALVCGFLVGGRLGFAILFALAFVIIRNASKLMLTARPSTLDGKPLPVYLYFIPSPTYVGPNVMLIQMGFGLLVIGILCAGVIGWLISPGSVVAPLHLNQTDISLLLGSALAVGFMYGLLIALVEFRPPGGRPPQTEPWLTLVLSLAVGVLVGLALEDSLPPTEAGPYSVSDAVTQSYFTLNRSSKSYTIKRGPYSYTFDRKTGTIYYDDLSVPGGPIEITSLDTNYTEYVKIMQKMFDDASRASKEKKDGQAIVHMRAGFTADSMKFTPRK
jgi:hypothetical protein